MPKDYSATYDLFIEISDLRSEITELVRLLANATDPENAGDIDEAREVGWAHIVKNYPEVAAS